MTTATRAPERTGTTTRTAPPSAWRRLRTAFATVPTGRQVPGTPAAFVLGLTVGAAASAYTVHAGTTMDYGDAMAHLTIARRVTDSMDPGLSQLGTVWLPLPHLLLLPLVQSLFLFRTGLAACILGALCLGASSAALYRITARIGLPPAGRLVALAVLLANPSLLYASTTALTEPVLVAALLLTIAGLAGWAFNRRRLSGGELAVFAGVPAAAGVLTRYEAWALVISGAIFVVIVVLRRGDGVRRALALAASFAFPPLAAIGWWVAYNTATYGNPTEFLTGQYSAAAFTELYIEKGQLTTKGNVGLSAEVLGWAMLETVGLVVLVGAAIGLLLMTARQGLDNRALVVWLAGTSTAFLLVSLVGGQHIMVNEMSLPPGAYNNRYALSAVPWAALLCGYAVSYVVPRRAWKVGRPLAVAVAAVALTAQNVWWVGDPDTRMTVIEEAIDGKVSLADTVAAATWLHEHYDGGGILMDENSDKMAVAPRIGVPLRELYYRASGDVFEDAVAAPEDYARWVLMHREQVSTGGTRSSTDQVTAALADDPMFHVRYRMVFSSGDIGVYRRVTDPTDPPFDGGDIRADTAGAVDAAGSAS
ncbi:MAG: hypothetical protein CMH83_12910 [Nocardioides sp.]|nr:hypothetical protein [Nocardioides sp.]